MPVPLSTTLCRIWSIFATSDEEPPDKRSGFPLGSRRSPVIIEYTIPTSFQGSHLDTERSSRPPPKTNNWRELMLMDHLMMHPPDLHVWITDIDLSGVMDFIVCVGEAHTQVSNLLQSFVEGLWSAMRACYVELILEGVDAVVLGDPAGFYLGAVGMCFAELLLEEIDAATFGDCLAFTDSPNGKEDRVDDSPLELDECDDASSVSDLEDVMFLPREQLALGIHDDVDFRRRLPTVVEELEESFDGSDTDSDTYEVDPCNEDTYLQYMLYMFANLFHHDDYGLPPSSVDNDPVEVSLVSETVEAAAVKSETAEIIPDPSIGETSHDLDALSLNETITPSAAVNELELSGEKDAPKEPDKGTNSRLQLWLTECSKSSSVDGDEGDNGSVDTIVDTHGDCRGKTNHEERFFEKLFRDELAFQQQAPPPSEVSDDGPDEVTTPTDGACDIKAPTRKRVEAEDFLQKLFNGMEGIPDRASTSSNLSDSSLEEEEEAEALDSGLPEPKHLTSLRELLFNLKADEIARNRIVNLENVAPDGTAAISGPEGNRIRWGSDSRFVYPKEPEAASRKREHISSITRIANYCRAKLSTVDLNSYRPLSDVSKRAGVFINPNDGGSDVDSGSGFCSPTDSLSNVSESSSSYLRVIKNTIPFPCPQMVWDTTFTAQPLSAPFLPQVSDAATDDENEPSEEVHQATSHDHLLAGCNSTVELLTPLRQESQSSYGTFNGQSLDGGAGVSAVKVMELLKALANEYDNKDESGEALSRVSSVQSFRSHTSTALLKENCGRLNRAVSEESLWFKGLSAGREKEKENKRDLYGDVKGSTSKLDENASEGCSSGTKSIRRMVLGELTERTTRIRGKISEMRQLHSPPSPRKMGYLRVRHDAGGGSDHKLLLSSLMGERKVYGGSQLSVIDEEGSPFSGSFTTFSAEQVKAEVVAALSVGSSTVNESDSLTKAVGRKIVGKMKEHFGGSFGSKESIVSANQSSGTGGSAHIASIVVGGGEVLRRWKSYDEA